MRPIGGGLTPALLGVLLGSAVQINQEELASIGFYIAFVPVALIITSLLTINNVANWARFYGLVLAFVMLAFGLTGLRAAAFMGQSLDTALEGRNLVVTGVVAAMPQRNEAGLRFRFDVDTALLDDQPVRMPTRLELAWYRGVFARGDGPGELLGELQRVPAALQAGERWQFTVRLKAPHGAINPHGFDYELWQWEQGVQATGYVRAGALDPVPQSLGSGWQHPIEWARGNLRERIFERVTDAKAAGLIAALVVGDQGSIDGLVQKSCSPASFANLLIYNDISL